MAQDYRNLVVWQKAIELTVCTYKLTQSLPKDEIYGLSSQMRRASVSIASNIAEGRGRLNPREFRQFLGLAQGSTYELQTQLVVVNRLRLTKSEDLEEATVLLEEISKMLHSFIHTLNSAANRKEPLKARS
ncbi:four helix bundle protein [Telmatobacter sp. DSM 110680]|uniref:Four helix bundle protein n=1 Tax=Telmatobacter sp. DSM 110680 TaxID=3036704 RepID=A0AAU7DGC6_9BACT